MNQTDLKHKLSAPFDFNEWKNILAQMFPKIDYLAKETSVDNNLVKNGGQIGVIHLNDGRSLGLFKFEVADNIHISRNRKGLREIAAKYVDQDIINGALVLYYSGIQTEYRLTFVSKQTVFDSEGNLSIKETAPKRYTFLLGESEPCTTAANRLIELINKNKRGSVYLDDVTEAFSVERLNKDFFNGYKTQYKRFVDTLTNTKQHRDYVKKLLGRLVFLQFLQKKGWMGVPASSTKWENGDKNYFAKLVEKYLDNNRLLSDVLEPLFFGVLNTKPEEREALFIKKGWNISLLTEFEGIPYLNGGLFEPDNIDNLTIDFPYSYFKELMDFFAIYNFTIDENDPEDSEVGIDPEMLGHIFENLLEDNKDKGAFYTPKEIVQYMCRQSVIQYLKTHEPSEQYAEAIEQLINDGIVNPILQNKNIAIRFTRLLKEVKVCDPAIGSGAFPMGILYVLYHAIHHLHSHAEPHGNFNSTQTKRDIIQNNIFGVDIEQGAVDIARLRFWLALVVDAEEPQPLPNLDYKITCGNSLLSRYPIDAPIENVFVEYNKGKKENEKMTLAKYKELVSEYTNTSNHQTKELFRQTIEGIKRAFKTELSNQFKEKLAKLRGKVIMLEGPTLFGERTKAEKAELKKLKEKLNILEKEQEDIQKNKLYVDAFEWRFEFPQLFDKNGLFTGFDITIGNPPYNELRDLDLSMQTALKLSRHYEYAKGGRLNMFQFFYPLAINIARDNGIVSMITQNSILAEDSALGNRKLFFAQTDILSIDSFPERDNKNLRVFESAKMSVCICTLRRNNQPDAYKTIPINVWHSRFMQVKHKLNITVLKHLPENEQKRNWRILEMYETENGDKKVPKVVTYQSPLSKAYAYFRGENYPIDYNACGNNQRQALEEIFKEQFKAYTLKNENNELVNVDGLMIGECIIKAKEMYTKIGFDIDLLDELDIHRTQSLNPSSHHNPQSNFYKLELKRTFEIIRLLQEYKIVQLIKKDNNITFSVNCEDGFIYNYEVQILDDILVYKKPNNPYFVNLADKRKYAVEKCNGKKAGHTTNGFSLQEFYDDTIRGLIENIHKNPIVEKDVLDIFKYNGRSINELLAEMNN